MDFVVRVDYSEDLEEKIESKAENRRELSEIRDEFYRPEGKDLSDFSPGDLIVRKRSFPDGETLVKIDIIDKPLGYTDTKEDLENLEGYEKWGEFTSFAVQYDFEVEEQGVKLLKEEFSFGNYVKIEAPSEEVLDRVVEKLDLEKTDLIEKNSALLLAEHENVI